MKSIEQLEKLTQELPPISNLGQLIYNPGNIKDFTEYKVEGGLSVGASLLSKEEIGVMDLIVTKGGQWPVHAHTKEKEWGVIYKGKIEVTCGGIKRILEPGDMIFFEQGELHCATALEDTWLIAISIPRIEGYPG